MRRFWLRSLLAPVTALRWRAFASAFLRDRGGALPDARLLSKPLHGYLVRGLTPSARAEVLLTHYHWCAERLDAAVLRTLLLGRRLEIAALEGRRGSAYRLVLAAATRADIHTQREGEFAIGLVREGCSTPLSRLTFTFVEVGRRIVLAIGGLQGPPGGGKRRVIEATRDLHGLRPKDAALLAARALAEALSIEEVHAVSDAHHVHRYREGQGKFASYDLYWRERGARETGPFGFVFPPFERQTQGSARRDVLKAAVIQGARRLTSGPDARGAALGSPLGAERPTPQTVADLWPRARENRGRAGACLETA
jgi:uncharacterized protein VirK/YbjX